MPPTRASQQVQTKAVSRAPEGSGRKLWLLEVEEVSQGHTVKGGGARVKPRSAGHQKAGFPTAAPASGGQLFPSIHPPATEPSGGAPHPTGQGTLHPMQRSDLRL